MPIIVFNANNKKNYGIKTAVGEGVDVNFWDFSINRDRTMQANLLDITNERKEDLIDRNVPSDKNVSVKVFEKLNKYKKKKKEDGNRKKKWHLKTKTVRIVFGALGLKKKGTEEQQINKIPFAPSLPGIPPKSSNKHILFSGKRFVHLSCFGELLYFL